MLKRVAFETTERVDSFVGLFGGGGGGYVTGARSRIFGGRCTLSSDSIDRQGECILFLETR